MLVLFVCLQRLQRGRRHSESNDCRQLLYFYRSVRKRCKVPVKAMTAGSLYIFLYRNVRQGCKVPVKTITTRSFFVSMEGLGTAVRFQ